MPSGQRNSTDIKPRPETVQRDCGIPEAKALFSHIEKSSVISMGTKHTQACNMNNLSTNMAPGLKANKYHVDRTLGKMSTEKAVK